MWFKVSRGPLQKGQLHALSTSETTNLPILALEGRISHAIFQRKCFSLAWSLWPQRVCQAATERGEDLLEGIKETSLADFTEKVPEGEGIQDHLSPLLVWGMWIWRMFCTVARSKRSWRRSSFHNLFPGKKRSSTEKSGRSTKFALGLGLKQAWS